MDAINPPSALDIMQVLETQEDLIQALYMAFAAIEADDRDIAPMRTLLMVILDKGREANDRLALIYAAEQERRPVTDLSKLIADHAAAYRVWADCDNESQAEQKRLSDELNTANKQLLAHRPVSMGEVKAKAEYMARNECFLDWSSISGAPILRSLTPEEQP